MSDAKWIGAGKAFGKSIELATLSTSERKIDPVSAGVFLDGFLIGFLQTAGVKEAETCLDATKDVAPIIEAIADFKEKSFS